MSVPFQDYIRKYEPFWGSWRLDGLIGEGSFGRVYKIFKEEWGFRYESALKHITVPTREQFREAKITLKQQEQLGENYFEDAVKGIINEVRAMYTLKGNSNIVAYEDHLVEKRQEDIGWDIFIRMEYVVSLHDYLLENAMNRKDILRMGIEICAALDLCGRTGIIHRDIKDDNIFISPNGCFKLGDFGIARGIDTIGNAGSIKGTPLYMAPEVFKAEQYDARADIYSLGIVLYRLLNYGRLPFMPPFPKDILYRDAELAMERRMSGKIEPYPPLRANTIISSILLKAISYNPELRYISAAAMREDLIGALNVLSLEEQNEIIIDVRANYHQEKKVIRISGAGWPKAASSAKSIQVGNHPGNIVNGGLAAYQENYIYFTDVECNLLKRYDQVTKQIQNLADDCSWFINVVDNWIYYSNASDDDKLYRITVEGTRKEKLNNTRCWDIQIYDNWIYYIDECDHYKIYKMRLDGTDNIKVNDDVSGNLCVQKSGIYYSNQGDGNMIYKINHYGSNKSKLNNFQARSIQIVGEWLYYINQSKQDHIYRIKLDGTEEITLSDDMCAGMNVFRNWVYYINKSDRGKLYRINTDGSCKQRLNNENTEYICIVDKWILYYLKGKEKTCFMIDLDGGNKYMLNSEIYVEEDEWIFL